MTDTIKAVHLVRYGDPAAAFALVDEPAPGPPGPGEVLVRVDYAPINLNDIMVALGIYPWRPELPTAIGNEGAGTVLAVGPDVDTAATGLTPGTRVVLPFMIRSWRERLLAPAAQLVPLPADADQQQAAMLAINGVTSLLLLDDQVALQPGDGIVFNAATSGLAHWLASLAAKRRLKAIAIVRRADDVEKIASANPGLVVGHDGEDPAAILARAGNPDVRLALDGVSGAATAMLTRLLSSDATLVTYGAASKQPMQAPSGDVIFKRLTVRGFWEGFDHNAARVVPILRDLVDMIGPGGVRQPIAAVYPLARLAEAIAHATQGGKVLLAMSDI